jgi:hypothetical protein
VSDPAAPRTIFGDWGEEHAPRTAGLRESLNSPLLSDDCDDCACKSEKTGEVECHVVRVLSVGEERWCSGVQVLYVNFRRLRLDLTLCKPNYAY